MSRNRPRLKAEGGGTVPRYPWERWFGVPRSILLRNRDYYCTTIGFAQQVRMQAKKRGVAVSVHTTQDSVTIELRRVT